MQLPLTSAVVVRLVSAFIALGWLGGAAAYAQPAEPDTGAVADRAVRLTNDFRSQEGLAAVKVDARLLAAARYFAGHLAKTANLSHEADGSTPAARAQRHGYDYCVTSENIAYRYSSEGFTTQALAKGFVEGWKDSPGHRRNMLDPDVTETAVAVAPGKPGHYYAVQLFGRPAAQAIRFSIANRADAPIRYRIADKAWSLGPRQARTHQHCRSSPIEFDWGSRDASVTPRQGDRLVVVRSGAGFKLAAE